MAKRQPTRPDTEPAAPQQAGEYTVVARRYRPQQFAELVGQEPVARALTNALEAGRVAHAYLFTGARGVGKTSTARILAKALNCEKGPTPTPCDKCSHCLAIMGGEDIDVLEIDGASNRRIEEVRDIRQNVQTRPSRSRYKVYIIDEVHMLTREAFNALLKTLEEPPPHVKFIFATTEIQKIPITILSRCQRFDFAGIGASRISERLKQVVAAEGKQADDEALQLVARRAGGSMRDAQSLLDQLLAFGGERLTAAQVHSLLGTAGDERILQLAAAIAGRDAAAALQLLTEFADAGLQLGELLDQMIEYWRNLMLIGCAGPDFQGLDLPEAVRATIIEQAKSLPLDSILAGLEVLTAAKARFRGSSHGLVLLEMAVVRLCRLADLVPVSQLAQWLSQPGSAPAPRPGGNPVAPRAVESPESKKKPVTAPERPAAVNGQANGANGSPVSDSNSFEQVWSQVLVEVGPMHAGQLEKAGTPAIFGPKSLVIRFPGRYTGAYDYCKEAASLSRLEETLRRCGGPGWSVRVELEPDLDRPTPAAAVPPPPASTRQREREVLQHPLLSRAVEVLGARLMKMEDGFGEAPAPDAADTTES